MGQSYKRIISTKLTKSPPLTEWMGKSHSKTMNGTGPLPKLSGKEYEE